MKLLDAGVEHRDGTVRLAGRVQRRAGGTFELFFDFPGEYASFVRDSADAFVPALLVPSLEQGEDLEIAPPISERLLRRLPRIQDVLVSWYAPALRRISVAASPRREPERDLGTGVGALFSSGVDSFYSLMKSERGGTPEVPPVTHLLYLRSLEGSVTRQEAYEAPLDRSIGTDESRQHVEAVAQALGKRVIAGASNLRAHFSLNYETYYFGSALAAAGLALSGGLRWLLLPSSRSYAELVPCGSHPLLDELWSTERLELVHDGGEARRVDKIERLVAGEPLALEHLRVCLENEGRAFNCGKCRKCVRTMMALDLLGALPRARTFPDRLHHTAEAMLHEDHEELVHELLDLARSRGTRPDLVRMLERVTRRRRRRRAVRSFVENVPVLRGAVPLVDRLRRRLSGEAAT